jgi:hypothetical protein
MARPFVEKVQQLWGTVLNIVGLDREPREAGNLQVSNKGLRVLAHLAAQDGKDGRLVLCDTAGRLVAKIVDGDGDALALTAAGRVGVRVHDGNDDARLLALDASGRALVVQNCSTGLPPYADGMGVLYTRPADHVLDLAIWESVQMTSGLATFDLQSANPRTIRVVNGHNGLVDVYESDDGGGKDTLLGSVAPYGVGFFAVAEQYIDVYDPSGSATAWIGLSA